MTVKELIEKLRDIPGDCKVYIASDEEGNSVPLLEEVEESCTNMDGPCHPDDAEENYPKACVLWP